MKWKAVFAAANAALAAICGAMDAQTLKKKGGLIAKEGSGRFLIVECRKHAVPEIVRNKTDYLTRLLGIRTGVTTNAAERATITILLTNGDRETRTRTKTTEPGIGVIEIAESSHGDDAAKDFDAAFAHVATELLVPKDRKTAVSRRQIEAVFAGNAFTMMAVNEVKRLLLQAGFSPDVIATYETACREGWAPAPTNDAQRTIWAKMLDEKERGPANPILILPPGMGEGGLRRRANAGGISDNR